MYVTRLVGQHAYRTTGFKMATFEDEDCVRIEEASDCFRVEEAVNDIELSRLSKEVEKQLNISKVKDILRLGKSLDILICGKTGCGKSTLVNGLIGVRLAEEGSDKITPCTSEAVKYTTSKGKIDITIWDTPGLIDGTGNQEQYLRDIEEKCPSVHIKLYCINSSQTRFVKGEKNQDLEAMQKFTKAFGSDFWENVVIVLTMANVIEAFRPSWKTLSPKKKSDKFVDIVDQYKASIRSSLKNYVKVPENIVEKMKIVPAGYYDDPKLPDRDYWLSDFYFECLDALPSPDSKGALLKLNLNRLKTREEVKDSDFKTEIELQPLVFPPGYTLSVEGSPQNPSVSSPNEPPKGQMTDGHSSESSKSKQSEGGIGEGGAAGIGGGVGGVVGAGLGFIGLLGGPLAFVTVPAGAAAGGAVGAGLGYLTKRIMGMSQSSTSESKSTDDKSSS